MEGERQVEELRCGEREKGWKRKQARRGRDKWQRGGREEPAEETLVH